MGTIGTISVNSSWRHMPIMIGTDVFAEMRDIPLRLWAQVSVGVIVGKWHKRRSRLHLRNLSDDQLRDIGVSRHQANHEADKVWF